MLKPTTITPLAWVLTQPPSGGCVLKQAEHNDQVAVLQSAAFGRLRVETTSVNFKKSFLNSAAFGRLRVETDRKNFVRYIAARSAAFGRLRVETLSPDIIYLLFKISRLRAAAC